MNLNVVSLLPRVLHERIERAMAERFYGSIEIKIENGSISGFKVTESVHVDERNG